MSSGPFENEREVENRSDGASDLALVRRAIKGDAAARTLFIERMKCVPRMLLVRNAKANSALRPDELEDLAQETLVAIWRRLDTFRGEATLETWACAFCHRAWLDAIKRKVRGGAQTGPIGEVVGNECEQDSDRFDPLYRAIDALDANEAQIVRYKHFEQLTFEQISKRMDLASSTIKSCYYQAIERIRARLLSGERGKA